MLVYSILPKGNVTFNLHTSHPCSTFLKGNPIEINLLESCDFNPSLIDRRVLGSCLYLAYKQTTPYPACTIDGPSVFD